MRRRLLELFDHRPHREDVLRYLPRLYPHLFKHPEEAARYLVLERDIEVSAFGGVVVTINHPGLWKDLLAYSPEFEGGRYPDLEKKDLPTEVQRVVVVRGVEAGARSVPETTRLHELFHDIYAHTFVRMKENVGYTDPGRREMMEDLKNELIAYALSHRWQSDPELLMRNPHAFFQVRTGLEITYRKKTPEEIDEIVSKFRGEMKFVYDELFRLAFLEDTSFDLALTKLIAAQTVKEIVFQLRQIHPEPILSIKATDLIRMQDGVLIDKFLERGLEYAASRRIPLTHVGELRRAIESHLARSASMKEPNFWYDASLRGILDRLPTDSNVPKPTP